LRYCVTYHERRNKPNNSGQESEGFGSLPTSAHVTAVEEVPVKDSSAWEMVNSVDEQTECSEPCEGDKNVNWSLLDHLYLHKNSICMREATYEAKRKSPTRMESAITDQTI